MKLAVVVPAYQEEKLLRVTLENIPQHVWSIVVVDDGSRDRTFGIAKSASTADPRIHVMRLGFNQGVGRAIAMGYQRAIALGADRIAVMAGDNQMNPDDLDRLVSRLDETEAGYVKGNRLMHRSRDKMPLVRRVGTKLLAVATAWVGDIDSIDDAQCGYTVATAEALTAIDLDDVFPRYGYPNQMLIDLSKAGVKIAEEPVEAVYADEVSGFTPTQVVLPIGGILFRALLRS